LQSDTWEIGVVNAEGQKCDRCWNYSTHVENLPNIPTACERCVPALLASVLRGQGKRGCYRDEEDKREISTSSLTPPSLPSYQVRLTVIITNVRSTPPPNPSPLAAIHYPIFLNISAKAGGSRAVKEGSSWRVDMEK
jgi:hypothetical protein